MMPDIIPQSSLVAWLRGNAIATLVLAISILTGSVGAVWAVSKWVNGFETQIAVTQSGLVAAGRDVAALQTNIVSLDGRVNELRAKVLELHNLTEAAARDLRARLDTIDALARFSSDRSFQAPLPKGPGR